MKTCPYCKIEVGGDFTYCPLCQNPLIGQAEEKYWPSPASLKKSFQIRKILGFAVFAAVIVCFLLDLWDNPLQPSLTWSPIVIIWLLIGGITANSILHTHREPAGVFTRISIAGISALVISTPWFPLLVVIIPLPLMGILGINFVSTLLDKSGHVMINFLCCFITGVLSWVIVIVLLHNRLGLLWRLCFMVSCITFVGILIFKGRALISEIQKRFTL